MKTKKILLSLLLCILCITPVQAASAQQILLLSKDLPYAFLITIDTDDQIQIKFIPNNVTLPIACVANSAATLQSLDFEKQEDCVKESIENFYQTEIDNVAILHMDVLSDDFDMDMLAYDFKTTDGMSKYFQTIAKKVKLSDMTHYKDYIDSDISLGRYYSLYKTFTKKKVSPSYGYGNYLVKEQRLLPMDNNFTIKKK